MRDKAVLMAAGITAAAAVTVGIVQVLDDKGGNVECSGQTVCGDNNSGNNISNVNGKTGE